MFLYHHHFNFFPKNLRNLSEAEEGGEEKITMKITIKLREIERETKHLFITVSFQVMYSFLIYKLMPRCLP